MTNESYLKLFGLKKGYSLEEIRLAYKRLVRKWHPDNFANESERQQRIATEKMQEINAAYEYLKNNISECSFDLNEYKSKLSSQLNEYLNFEQQNVYIIESTIKNITQKIFSFRFRTYRTKQEVDDSYNAVLQFIKEEYDSLKRNYYQMYFIFETEVEESLNYNCHLNEFYEQLEKIKNKYSKEILFEKRVAQETTKYKTYVGYSQIENEVDICCKKALCHAKNNLYRGLNKIIEDMHVEIEICFSKYFELINRLNIAIQFFEDCYPDVSQQSLLDLINNKMHYSEISKLTGIAEKEIATFCLILKFQELINKCPMEEKLSEMEQNMEFIEQRIIKKQEEDKKQAIKAKNALVIDELFQDLINKGYKVISSLKVSSDYEQIECIYKLISHIVSLIKFYHEGKIKLEQILLLDSITFTDLEEDFKTVLKISGCFKEKKSSDKYPELINSIIFKDKIPLNNNIKEKKLLLNSEKESDKYKFYL